MICNYISNLNLLPEVSMINQPELLQTEYMLGSFHCFCSHPIFFAWCSFLHPHIQNIDLLIVTLKDAYSKKSSVLQILFHGLSISLVTFNLVGALGSLCAAPKPLGPVCPGPSRTSHRNGFSPVPTDP